VGTREKEKEVGRVKRPCERKKRRKKKAKLYIIEQTNIPRIKRKEVKMPRRPGSHIQGNHAGCAGKQKKKRGSVPGMMVNGAPTKQVQDGEQRTRRR